MTEVKVLDMELNGGCNLKCKMCPQATGREKDFLKKIPLDVFEKVLDDAMQYGLETVTLHGSGEPTLIKNMATYVRAVKKRGLTCISFTNGLNLNSEMSRTLIDAGLDILRLSVIGYDQETYNQWMAGGNFYKVRNNFRDFVSMAKGHPTEGHLNHLIIDKDNIPYEIEQYRENWGIFCGAQSEIWTMHNWAGNDKVELQYIRKKDERRTCGRPFAPLLQVRAGGTDGHNATVTACCMTLGQDSKAELGYLDTQTIEQVVNGERYKELRKAHEEERFDDIPYCKDCDQLYDYPDALVWTDIPDREYGQSKSLKSLHFGDKE